MQNLFSGRSGWVDLARGIGIFLMFYGHLLQKGFYQYNTTAAEQIHLIYSFHMPMFFVISGFFFQPSNQIFNRIGQLVLRRLIPVVLFSLILLPLWFRDELLHHLSWSKDLLMVAVDYAHGWPDLNWVTWFLVCLFICESIAINFLGRIKVWHHKIIVGFICLAVGLLFSDYSMTPADGFLFWVGRSWFLSESIVALGFYIIGYAAYPFLCQLAKNRRLSGMVFLLASTLVFATYSLNHPSSGAVMMASRMNGNNFYFVFTALAGALAVFSLGMLLKKNQVLEFIGRNSLSFLGLNGLFYHYIDPKFLHILEPANNEINLVVVVTLVTILSLIFCAPFTYLLNRMVPQLVGKTNVSGPILPALERRNKTAHAQSKL